MPLLLRLFIVFCMIAALYVLMGMILPLQNFREVLIPYLGSAYGFPFIFPPMFVVAAYFSGDVLRPDLSHLGVFPLVALLMGAWDFFVVFIDGNEFFDDPYLWIHPFRPFFTIVIPSFWVFVLGLPHIHSWTETVNRIIRS